MPAYALNVMTPPPSSAPEAGDSLARLSQPVVPNSIPRSVSSDMPLPTWSRRFEDDVAISGMACRLPESDSVNEFRDNLMNHVDMVTEDNRRWTPGAFGLPKRAGKLKDLSKFDATFFGVHAKQANRMDPQLRMLLEVTHEAIVDAGVDPTSLRGSKTGVFVGASASESSDSWSADSSTTSGFTMIGCQRGMFSNRLSYFFDFKGPSFTIDTACSSSLLALDQALLAIRTGQCDQAIVAGSSICIKPATAAQFNNLNMTSAEGACKSFDASGNGYARSEGIAAMLLQKSHCSKRIYAKLVHSKNNSDGNKEQGKSITFPSGVAQASLMREVYEESGVSPCNIVYVEAHGTGTAAGDPTELNAITEIFCKGRQDSLLIGSVKSNMGHPEPVSGLAALTKLLIASEEGTIPANLHYNTPNPDIPALSDGRLQVVSTNRKWSGGLTAINSFGFGGSNVHTLLDTNVASADQKTEQIPTIPLLLTYCGRTEQALRQTIDMVQRDHPTNLQLHALLNETAHQPSRMCPFRGFSLIKPDAVAEEAVVDVKKYDESQPRPIWYIFSGMGSQWFGMAKSLMQLQPFKESIVRSSKYLQPYNFNLRDLIASEDAATFSDVINAFVGIAAIQVALVDVLSCMGVSPDGMVGHSVGELGCGYADGSLTARETVLAAYWRGRCISEAELEAGAMAAVGLTWDEARSRCPKGVVAACHNTVDTVTISGPKEAVSKFVTELKAEGVFAREVASNGVAFHSYYMCAIAPKLKERLNQVIEPKKRSSKWISTSIPSNLWGSDLHSLSSADYHVNNLVSPVLFQEGLACIPKNAITIEIAPHALLQSILKRSLSTECVHVPLQKRGETDNLTFFYNSVGQLYQSGVKVNPSRLYGTASFPVSKGTPSISSLLAWDHSVTYDVPTEKDFQLAAGGGSGCTFDINLKSDDDEEQRRLVGHQLDGRVLYPAAGYLLLVWKTLARQLQCDYEDLPVIFRDVVIHNATILPPEGTTQLSVVLLPSGGDFEVLHQDKVAVSGKITCPEEGTSALINLDDLDLPQEVQPELVMEQKDVYKELRLRGYEYGPTYQGILKASMYGESGSLLWDNDWSSFMDALLQLTILSGKDRVLRLPTRLKSVHIDPRVHKLHLENNQTEEGLHTVTAKNDTDLKLVTAGGVQIYDLNTTSTTRRKDAASFPILEKYCFVPERSEVKAAEPEFQDYLDCCSFVAYSSMKNVSDNSQALRLPKKFIQDLADLSRSATDATIEQLTSDLFSSTDERYSLLRFLQQLSSDCQSKDYELRDDFLLSNLLRTNSLKSALDVVLENCPNVSRIKVCEMNGQRSHLYRHILKLYDQQPVIQVEMTVCDDTTDWECEREDAVKKVVYDHEGPEDQKEKPSDQHLVVGSDLLGRADSVLQLLKPGGFILSLELNSEFEGHLDLIKQEYGLEVVFTTTNPLHTLVLLKRKPEKVEIDYIYVDGFTGEWVEPLKEKLTELESRGPDSRLWIVAHQANGAVGLINCLKMESAGDRIRCIFNTGVQPLPSMDSQELQNIIFRDLVMNVYKDGVWGTYRHLPLLAGTSDSDQFICRPSEYSYLNVIPSGSGFSNLRWIESPLAYSEPSNDSERCRVNYSAINFRDIMLSSGKLSADAIPNSDKMQGCLLGMEFSGVTSQGRNVMGICAAKALATAVDVKKEFLWDVPTDWTMEDAATVPVVYSTAYYALCVRGGLKSGESILIHSGSGGVGQAAISIALSMKCTVFTTVGTEEKRNFLLQKFPGLKRENILNSRSCAFEQIILRKTYGKGVNMVLNSLAEDKLQASVRVLSKHARFLEIGKFDLSNDNKLGMAMFLKNISFHGILLDSLFELEREEAACSSDWITVRDMVQQGIKSGVVQPLARSTFNSERVEEAFRYMAAGKHIGKVLIQMPENDIKIKSVSRYFCHPEKTYLICGGLGGFGLELADWLVQRGASKLILTSRSGVTNGYQSRRVDCWREVGVTVVVSRRNAANYSEASALIDECQELGPLGGVFNLAMVLRDGLLENLTQEDFRQVFEPKVLATRHLSILTSQLHSIDSFVCFSSISGGRGNAGQSNYGFANTDMERICEARVNAGLPGLAIQWGAIGEVGVVATSMDGASVGGTLPQRITSCLESMETFMVQNNCAVVSSFVNADKRGPGETSADLDIVSTVLKTLGIADANSISRDSTLGDLGLDSLTSVEVKQTLERNFNLQLSMKEIRALTVKSLQELGKQNQANDSTSEPKEDVLRGTPSNGPDSIMPIDSIVKLNVQTPVASGNPPVFFIHPIEGHIESLRPLSEYIQGYTIYGIQCTKDTPTESIEAMAAQYEQMVRAALADGLPPQIVLIGYSFGACAAIELAIILSQSSPDISINLILLDGSHDYVRSFTSHYDGLKTEMAKENQAFISFVETFKTKDDHVDFDLNSLRMKLSDMADLEKRLDLLADLLNSRDAADVKISAMSYYNKLKAAHVYHPKAALNCKVALIKAEACEAGASSLDDTYNLAGISATNVQLFTCAGDHRSFIQAGNASRVAATISKCIDCTCDVTK